MNLKRVIGRMYTSYNSRTDEHTETLVQYLQERKSIYVLGVSICSYWKTLEKEVVPTFAWIQQNTLGSTDWKSKWFGLEDVKWNTK